MYEIRFSALAKEDITRIRIYLEEEFGSEVANIQLRELLQSIKGFEKFPLIGRPLMNVIDIPTDYMYFVVGKNYVFYRLEKQVVKIIRILDTRQDYIDILF